MPTRASRRLGALRAHVCAAQTTTEAATFADNALLAEYHALPLWDGGFHCPGRPRGRLSTLGVFLCKSILYGAFIWARRALNSRKRRVPPRAVTPEMKAELDRDGQVVMPGLMVPEAQERLIAALKNIERRKDADNKGAHTVQGC
jgi:hypothetical protein